LWRSPTDGLVVATDHGAVDGLLSRLPPGAHALACAVDLSDGRLALEVRGAPPRLEAFLSRLIDPRALPRRPLSGTWTRLADIPVGVLRMADDSVWLLADRRNDRHLAGWVARAIAATGHATAPSADRG
jgi:hypothetical protein